MAQIANLPEVEQIEFFNSQRLQANDLNALDDFNRQMRWLHNCSLHTWGVATGFNVASTVGAREVEVSAGLALDNQGREILLLEKHREALPPVAGSKDVPITFYLTVHYPGADELETLETRAGVCSSSNYPSVTRRRAEPVFCWIALDPKDIPKNPTHRAQITNGEKIVLARVEVKNCQLAFPVDEKTRRNARPISAPYLACGKTNASTTPWELWEEKNVLLGVQAVIDTSSARFKITPCYSAHVAGNRFFQPDANYKAPFILDGHAFIHNPTEPTEADKKNTPSPSQFLLRVFLPAYLTSFAPLTNIVNVGTLFDHVTYPPIGMASKLVERLQQEANLITIPDDQKNVLSGKFVDYLKSWSPALGESLSKKLGEDIGKGGLSGVEIRGQVNALAAKISELLPGLAIPTPVLAPTFASIEVNPREVVNNKKTGDKFILIEKLRTDGEWHVIWTGVEE